MLTPINSSEQVILGIKLARKTAKLFFKKKGELKIDFDDFVGVALLAFTEALNSYDAKKNSSFKCYAVLKMRWAIKDFIKKEYQILGCGEAHKNPEKPLNSLKLLQSLGVGVDYKKNDYAELACDCEHDPESKYVKKDVFRKAWTYIQTLPKRNQQVMSMRYFNDRSFDDIAENLSYANNSSVVRMHQQIVQNLQTMLLAA